MAQPKAGRFRYRLDTVLRVREIKKRKEEEEFAKKKRAYLDEKQREEQIATEQSSRTRELRGILRQGPISDFEKVLRRRVHLTKLKGDLEKQIDKVIEASQHLEGQRVKLVESMKDKKIIDKDKEHKLAAWQKLMQNLETKFLDEIATTRFVRKKLEQERKL